MGDNRGDSRDSRSFGPIDEERIVGRAFVRVWPLTQIGFL
jgi:signal peptidase I